MLLPHCVQKTHTLEKMSKVSIFDWKVDGYTLDRVTHVCYSAQTIARQKFYTSQMGPNFQRKVFSEKGLVFKTTFGWIEKLVERKILLVYNAEQPKNTDLIEQILNAY